MSEEKYPGDNIIIMKGWDSLFHRPGMYMGKKSLFGLECLIAGVALANGSLCGGHGKDKFFEMSTDDWCDFEYWVKEKTHQKYKRSFAVALDLASQDDEKAFDIWTAWFKEWKSL